MRNLSEEEATRLVAQLDSSARQQIVRGLKFPHPFRFKFNHLGNVVFQDCDFSGTLISGKLFSRAVIDKCVFENIVFDALGCRKADFVRCSFKNVVFGKSFHGSMEDCMLQNCEIVDSIFKGFIFRKVKILDCVFRNLTTEKLKWDGCTFERVRTYGKLESVIFDDTDFLDTDFSQAVLVNCTIFPTQKNQIQLPERPDNFPLTGRALVASRSLLKSRISDKSYEHYCEIVNGLDESDLIILLNHDTFSKADLVDREMIIKILYENRARELK